jgi:hypothetical protein
VSAESLEAALRTEGIDCVVEAQERLAVIVPGPRGVDLSSAELRRRALELLPAHGFTHLAVELLAPPLAVDPAAERGAPLRRP